MSWRNSKAYKEWHDTILERDNYKCQICGSCEKLEVHHLNSANYFPKERFKLENGKTLCEKCHSNFHNNFKKSSRQKATKEDFENFVQLANYFKERFR